MLHLLIFKNFAVCSVCYFGVRSSSFIFNVYIILLFGCFCEGRIFAIFLVFELLFLRVRIVRSALFLVSFLLITSAKFRGLTVIVSLMF